MVSQELNIYGNKSYKEFDYKEDLLAEQIIESLNYFCADRIDEDVKEKLSEAMKYDTDANVLLEIKEIVNYALLESIESHIHYCDCDDGPEGRTVTEDFENQICERCGRVAE